MRRIFLFWCLAAAMSSSAGAQTSSAPQAPAPSPDAAQPPPRRPFRGIFRGADPSPGVRGWSATIAGFGGYDDDVNAQQRGSNSANGEQVRGVYRGLEAGTDYLGRRGRGVFELAGGTQIRGYQGQNTVKSIGADVRIASTLPVGRHTDLALGQSVNYSPFYRWSFFPPIPGAAAPDIAEPIAPALDRRVTAVTTFGADSTAALVRRSGRSTYRASYGYRHLSLGGPARGRDQTAAGEFSNTLTRHFVLRLGYGFEQRRPPQVTSAESTLHRLDLGGGYSRPLSFSRRTTVGVSGGTSVLADGVPGQGRRYSIRLDGFLHHEIGRTWLVRAAYEQGVQFMDLIAPPVYAYHVRATVGGLVGRRTDLRFEGGYATGELEASHTQAFSAVFATTRLSYSLTKRLAITSDYGYYDNAFHVPLVTSGVVTSPRRQSVRFGVSLWLPLHTPRNIDAAR